MMWILTYDVFACQVTTVRSLFNLDQKLREKTPLVLQM